MKKNIRGKSNGITLIVLVITIIALVILAGVALLSLVGENGILKRSIESKEQAVIGEEIDLTSLAYNAARIELLEEGKVTAADMNKQFAISGTDAVASGSNPIRVKFNETGNEYTVKEGKVEYAKSSNSDEEIEVDMTPTSEDFFTWIENEDGTITITGIVKNENRDPEGIGWYYTVETDTIISKTHVVFPSTINGKRVTRIGSDIFNTGMWSARKMPVESIVISEGIEYIDDNAFNNCTKIQSVILPDSLIEIGNYAFSGIGISSITFKNSLTSIGEEAFYYCSNLNNIEFSNSIINIGPYAFCGCPNLTNVTILGNIKNIVNDAFRSCRNLASITLLEGVENIGYGAFSYCAMKSIEIPASVTNIGPFDYCENLESIKVNSGNVTFDSRENCNAIIHTSTNTLVAGCKKTIIPNMISSISYSAFAGHTGLSSITIPESVTTILESAFQNCTALSSIIIPSGVTSINDYTFCGCENLSNITLPTGLNSIGGDAFANCAMTNITIPSNVKTIGRYAFSGCKNMTEFVIPDGVTTIAYDTFRSCSSLANITIPNSVTSIESWAFVFCSSLNNVIIPDGITSISAYTFYGCSALSNITLPNTITSIGYYAFRDCRGLNSIVLPESLKTIDQYSFQYAGLLSLTIPSSVTSIGERAFHGCENMKTLIIDSSSIASKAASTSESYSNSSYVRMYTDTIYVKTGLLPSSTTFPYKKKVTSDKTGYDKWVKNY